MDISQQEVDITCPKCKINTNVKLKQIEKEEIISCSGCQSEINLVDKNGSVKNEVQGINKSLKNLDNIIKNFGK